MKEPETNEEFIYSLIIDDIDQTISAGHRALLLEWRLLNETNEQTYQDFVQVHHNINELYEQQPYTSNSSWTILNQKIDDLDKLQPLPQRRNEQLSYWAGIAAAIIFTISLGYYFISNNRYIEVSNAQGAAVKYVTLPDGTQVALNSGTLIRYAKGGFKTQRSLQLVRGEAFVKVIHQTKYPFTIEMGDVQALDIGTSFNVSRNNQQVVLTVEEGVVALKHTKGNTSVILNKGSTGRYSTETGQITSSENIAINYKSWIDKDFVFSETPLVSATEQLAKVYNIAIDIQGNELAKRKLTAHLHYQKADSALHVIAATLQCKLSGSAGNYILSEN
jgi:transmembrane sensor